MKWLMTTFLRRSCACTAPARVSPHGAEPAGIEVESGVAAADKALEVASADALVEQVTAEVASGIRQRFAHVQEANKYAERVWMRDVSTLQPT